MNTATTTDGCVKLTLLGSSPLYPDAQVFGEFTPTAVVVTALYKPDSAAHFAGVFVAGIARRLQSLRPSEGGQIVVVVLTPAPLPAAR